MNSWLVEPASVTGTRAIGPTPVVFAFYLSNQFFQCRARHRLHRPDPAASSRPATVSPRRIAPAVSFAAHAAGGWGRDEDLRRWPMYWGAVSQSSVTLPPIHRKELFPATTEEVAEPFDIGGVRDGELSVSGGIHDEQAR